MGLIPETIPTITQVTVIDFRLSHFILVLQKFFHVYERIGYSGHVDDRGDTRDDDGDERGDISDDYGDKREDQRGDNGRGGYRSQDTRHYYSSNHGARVDVDGRGGCRYHTSHSLPINHTTVVYCCVYLLLLVAFTKVLIMMKYMIVVVFVFSSGHRNQITCSLLGVFSKPRAEVTRLLDSVLTQHIISILRYLRPLVCTRSTPLRPA